MSQPVEAYFEEKVIPLITREHPDLMSEMSVRVEGSFARGGGDELSDLDATVFLPERLWKERGGQLQLTLLHDLEPFIAHPSSFYPRDPQDWWRLRHSEISVHRLSELLCGQAESILAGEGDVPWEEADPEELLQLQLHLVLWDGQGALGRLRELTTSDRYPEWLWSKHLIRELIDVAGELEEFDKAVRRSKPLDAHMFLAEVIRMLFRVIFLMNKRYHPWRSGFLPMFKELPFGPKELLAHFEVLASEAGWPDKSAAVRGIVRVVTERIRTTGMLTDDMLRYLLRAWAEKAWENPDWLKSAEVYERRAAAAGYDPWYGWVWEQWGRE
jgi:hypothetical protein